MISWLFPSQPDALIAPTNEQILEAFEALIASEDAEALRQVMKAYAAVLFSDRALIALYLTVTRERIDEHEEVAQELELYLHLIRYAQLHSIAETYQRLSSAPSETDIIALFPTMAEDWLDLLAQARSLLNQDEHSLVFAIICQETGDIQSHIFDKTRDESLLDQAATHYSTALSLVSQQENSGLWAYLHMQRGIVSLHRRQGERADDVEQSITDLEAALSAITSESDPLLWATANRHLGMAFAERVYNPRAKNLQLAAAAYEAATLVLTLEDAPYDYIDIQQRLADIAVELRQEQQAKAAFSALQEAARYLEQQAMEQLDAENPSHLSTNTELLDPAIVAATVDAWSDIVDRGQLYTFLVEQQDILLTTQAQSRLRALLAEIEATDQDGRAEHLASLVRILENASAFSVEVAWQRYCIEILPALQAALLLSIQPTFQEMQLRIAEQQDVFTSPAMLDALYLIARGSTNSLEAEQIRQRISVLKQIRASHISPPPPPARVVPSVSQEETGNHEPAFSFSPADFAKVNLNDPYFARSIEELTRLPPQKMMTLLPYLSQVGSVVTASRIPDMDNIARLALEQLERHETPFLWASFHWAAAAMALVDFQGDQQQALAHCEAALSVLTRDTIPTAWAILMLTRGVIHMMSINDDTARRCSTAEREAHLRQAIRDFDTVEPAFAQRDNPFEWALLRVTRGMALYEQREIIAGWTNDKVEQVVADFDAAQPIIDKQGSEWHRICLHLYRARVLCVYEGGKRRANLERVISDCNTAIVLCQPRTSPTMAEFWANALVIRGVAYLERIEEGPRENIEQAIKDFDQALTVQTRSKTPDDWAITVINRGNAYMQRIEGEKQQNLEEAIKNCSDAIPVLQASGKVQAAAKGLMNRSLCYMQRVVGDRVQNQRKALADCSDALELFTGAGMRYEQATTLTNRAGIFMQMLAGDRRQNLERALADCDAALVIFSPAETPLLWAKTLVNRGMTRRGLVLSVALSQRGAGMRTFVQRQFNQHSESAFKLLTENVKLFEQALDDFSAALTVFSRDSTPRDWAATLRERAITYAFQTQGYFTGEREANMRRGILDFDAALTVFSRYETPYDWAITITNRGVLYKEMAQFGNRSDAEHALADTKEALSVFTQQAAPSSYCRLQHIRARVFAGLKQWSQAHDALVEARAAQRDLSANAASSQDRTDIIAEFALIDIYTQDAWAILHMDSPDETAAAIALEEGRAQSQRAALDLDDIHLDRIASPEARERMKAFLSARSRWQKLRLASFQHSTVAGGQEGISVAYNAFIEARECVRQHDNPDFMTPIPTFDGIVRALPASDEALVYLVAASQLTNSGGMAMIIARDREGVIRARSLLLPGLEEMALLDLIEVESGQSPLIRAPEAIAALGPAGLNDVAALLLREGIRKVRLIPYNWLGLFPLPATFISIGDGKKYHMTDLFEEVTIVPGARSLEIAHERIRHRDHSRRALLVAGNPTADLPYAEAEAATIQRIAQKQDYPSEQITYLQSKEITRAHVINGLAKARYAHLALHGQYHVGEPRLSRLVLDWDESAVEQERSIYLGEILDGVINVQGVRLIVLSACETSIIDMQRVPNEALGIAAGFMQAGAAAIIASLWAVDDRATFLLMTRFAQYYLGSQATWSPGRAFAAAQRWLREEATNRILADYDPVQGKSSTLRSLRHSYSSAKKVIQRDATRVAIRDPDALPYADPFYWAGFVVIGM